jgi:hypothetical protein
MLMKAESAVSPVIGVLLMLTLTLIIAAIVNSFAGGLMDTKDKSPVVTLQSEFHREDGKKWNLTIHHISGDPLPTCCVNLIIRPSKTFSCGYETIKELVRENIKLNTSSDKSWAEGISSMHAGDIHVISGTNDDIDQKIQPPGVDFLEESSIGNTFYLEFYYDRNLIARSEVLIQP